ncbi:hypothetical protein BSYN_22280 [Bacteroides sedimenti]|uniref:PH domain-containing protein n=2 Tax=Bacteroides sedimenti TaxID=2136147 RepID=A0ABM8IIH7_9BACE
MVYLYLFLLFPLLFYAFSKGIGKIRLLEDVIQIYNLFALPKSKICLNDLKGFEFMRDYYYSVPKGRGKYIGISGPTVMIFHFKDGKRKAFSLFGFHDIKIILTYLHDNNIQFLNYKPITPIDTKVKVSIYQKSGMQAFFTIISPLIILGAIIIFMVYSFIVYHNETTFHLLLCFLPLLLYFIYTYWERMYYLKMKDESFTIRNLLGRKSWGFKYDDTMKVSFGSSLGKGAFLYLEILDKNFKYYQFPLDMLPKKDIKEIVNIFKEKGVDATAECY